MAPYTLSQPETAKESTQDNTQENDITLSHGSKHLHLNTIQNALLSGKWATGFYSFRNEAKNQVSPAAGKEQRASTGPATPKDHEDSSRAWAASPFLGTVLLTSTRKGNVTDR